MVIKESHNHADDVLLTIARKCVSGRHNIKYCLEEDKFYIFENGLWVGIHGMELIDLLNEVERIYYLKIHEQENIIKYAKRLTKMRLNQFNWSEMMNLSNGMVSPYDGEMMDHDSVYYSTIRIPYNYDKQAKCDLWNLTLRQIFDENLDKINILQEFFGYCLTRDIRQEKALLLLGESRSGKSTILSTFQEVLGMDNCSHIALKCLNNPQYTSMMVNKLVNIDKEVSKKAEDFEAEFKTIVTGEEITCNDKFVKPFKFKPFCKIILSANIFPKITDYSSAFYNRLILIPCERVFAPHEQNRNLRAQLTKELPGILNWAIEGLARLNKRGHFEEVNFMKEAIAQLEDDNNPVNIFCRDCIEVKFNKEIEKGEMYIKYVSWCKETGNWALPLARFSTAFYKVFIKETPKDTKSAITNKRVWRNLQFKTEPVRDLKWRDDNE